MILYKIIWNIDPVAFSIFNFEIRWYSILFACAFIFGYIVMEKIILKKDGVEISKLDLLATYVVIGTVIGARLGHVLFYEPGDYLKNPISILYFRQGGLASHGGAIGILIAIWLYCRKTKFKFLWTLDRLVIVVALGGFFIRLGNLMNSEIYGYTTNLPWGFVFERNGENLPKHPTQIYEAIGYLIIFASLLSIFIKKYKSLINGNIFSIFLISLFGFRFIIEFLKEPQVGFENNMTLNMGQLLSIPFILCGIAILIINNVKKKKEINF